MKGDNILGFRYSAISDKILRAFSPELQDFLEGQFSIASEEEINTAFSLAKSAGKVFGEMDGERRANFLDQIATEILDLGDDLVNRAMQESGLPEGRIRGERGRTIGQLKLFANLLREGSWVEATIDSYEGKPDIRKMLHPIGPVVVFTASNFPLAFSTAGGDTASAFAAGCPVIVKSHESHLGTNAYVAYAIMEAAKKTGMPDGVFSSLNGTGPELGQQLVVHPDATAVAFTGSLHAGKAIYVTAQKRKMPIPVFAEMGSVNPVVLLPRALESSAKTWALEYANSITMGVGQFCTNPGIIISIRSENLNVFKRKLSEALIEKPSATMLNRGIASNYYKGVQGTINEEKVRVLTQPTVDESKGSPALASVDAAYFLDHPQLHNEVFGPFSLIVECNDQSELMKVVNSLEGQLTASIIADIGELDDYRDLISALRNRVGRLIYNGVPTGVEVCHAMHHGGPFPATTDSRFTSVGTSAIKRFVRPVAYQDWPHSLLPNALKADNPLGIWRLINGKWTNKES